MRLSHLLRRNQWIPLRACFKSCLARLEAPTGHQIIARGGAKRSPWSTLPNSTSPERAQEETALTPLQGSTTHWNLPGASLRFAPGYYLTPFQGFMELLKHALRLGLTGLC